MRKDGGGNQCKDFTEPEKVGIKLPYRPGFKHQQGLSTRH